MITHLISVRKTIAETHGFCSVPSNTKSDHSMSSGFSAFNGFQLRSGSRLPGPVKKPGTEWYGFLVLTFLVRSGIVNS